MAIRNLATVLFFFPLCLFAQQEEVFTVRKPVKQPSPPVIRYDTFIQQLFVSDKRECHKKIAYRNAIQIEDERFLIFFTATEGIINAVNWLSDVNAGTGEWRKLPYMRRADTRLFTFDEHRKKFGNSNAIVKAIRWFIGVKNNEGNMMVTEITSSENMADAQPQTEENTYALKRENILLVKKEIMF